MLLNGRAPPVRQHGDCELRRLPSPAASRHDSGGGFSGGFPPRFNTKPGCRPLLTAWARDAAVNIRARKEAQTGRTISNDAAVGPPTRSTVDRKFSRQRTYPCRIYNSIWDKISVACASRGGGGGGGGGGWGRGPHGYFRFPSPIRSVGPIREICCGVLSVVLCLVLDLGVLFFGFFVFDVDNGGRDCGSGGTLPPPLA